MNDNEISIVLDNEAVLYRNGQVFYKDKKGIEKLLEGDVTETVMRFFEDVVILNYEGVLYRKGQVFYRNQKGIEKLLEEEAAEIAMNILKIQPWILFETKANEIVNKYLE